MKQNGAEEIEAQTYRKSGSSQNCVKWRRKKRSKSAIPRRIRLDSRDARNTRSAAQRLRRQARQLLSQHQIAELERQTAFLRRRPTQEELRQLSPVPGLHESRSARRHVVGTEETYAGQGLLQFHRSRHDPVHGAG